MKMQKLVKIILTHSLICLSLVSCKSPDSYPRIADQEQLSPVFAYIEINGKQYIDLESSYCLMRIYRITKGYVGPTTQAVELHISECNKVIGYAPTEYGVFATWLENLRIWLINLL